MDNYNNNENFEEDDHLNELGFKTKRYSFLQSFYKKIKNKSSVLSKEEILTLCNKKGFFTYNIWYQNGLIDLLTNKGANNSQITFGLKSGLFFYDDKLTIIKGKPGRDYQYYYNVTIPIDKLLEDFYFSFKEDVINLYDDGHREYKKCSPEEKEILLELVKEWKVEYDLEKLIKEKTERENFENIIRTNSILISEIYSKLNIDSEGNLILEDFSDLSKLLERNQKRIIEIDKLYIQKFVKIIKYLSEKKQNIISIFKSDSVMALDQNERISYYLSTFDDQDNFTGKENWKIDCKTRLGEIINFLKGIRNQIHTYELVLFHSINMIISLIDNNMIVFYEIHECLDKLGIFNSNWENELSNRLSNIDENLNELVYTINKMENNIVNSVKKLTYITQESFKDLNFSVNKQLSSIDSTMKFNNLLTLIQTYEVYKINQNTKRLNL